MDRLIAKCGFYCGCCPAYEAGNCTGCRTAHLKGDCFTFDCVEGRKFDFCPQCEEFPCGELLLRDKATVLDKSWLRWMERRRQMPVRVRFYDHAPDEKLRFAVVVAQAQGRWVFCKHKQRDTFECPGGKREPGESILAAAERELREESGAASFRLYPVCVYSVIRGARDNPEEESFGMLYYGEIFSFEGELHSEMERVELFDHLPEQWTYPQIQPMFLKRAALWREQRARKGTTI